MAPEETSRIQQRVLEIWGQPERHSDKDIAYLRQNMHLMGVYNDRTFDMAHMRASLELIAAIRQFDKASGDLVTQTNRLTTWAVGLAVVGTIISVFSCAFALFALFK